jgi:hypothetical protein
VSIVFTVLAAVPLVVLLISLPSLGVNFAVRQP